MGPIRLPVFYSYFWDDRIKIKCKNNYFLNSILSVFLRNSLGETPVADLKKTAKWCCSLKPNSIVISFIDKLGLISRLFASERSLVVMTLLAD